MDFPKHDDFKWFGEGFQGFPRAVPEDCVEYTIYYLGNDGLSDFATREKLREVQASASKLVKRHLAGFIWQREAFQLKLVCEGGLHLLRGQTSYGDSIDDEWLIVWLLRELSVQFPNIWTRVVDADGQFLLIEAANALPLWLNPEIADFRVWINNGRLLIIPVDSPGGKNKRIEANLDTLDLKQALNVVQNTRQKLLHSPKIESEAFYRLQKYPQKIAESLHRALIKVPRKLAYILHEDPSYISAAVEAFYLRDPMSLRPLQSQSTEKLVFAPVDQITMSTQFTKVGFAQLVSQSFAPPPSWKTAFMMRGGARAKQHAEIGMKVTCGFEMLVSDPQKKDKKENREISMLLEEIQNKTEKLPTDKEIREWGVEEDSQNWLDIDFKEFEKELGGKEKGEGSGVGFGDSATQQHLRKVVTRFEDLLKDDPDAAEEVEFLDEKDYEADSSVSSDNGSSDEDLAYNQEGAVPEEKEFTQMMQKLMGMPPEVMQELMRRSKNDNPKLSKWKKAVDEKPLRKQSEYSTEDITKEDVLEAMGQTEEELRGAGALDLESEDQAGENLDQGDASPSGPGKKAR